MARYSRREFLISNSSKLSLVAVLGSVGPRHWIAVSSTMSRDRRSFLGSMDPYFSPYLRIVVPIADYTSTVHLHWIAHAAVALLCHRVICSLAHPILPQKKPPKSQTGPAYYVSRILWSRTMIHQQLSSTSNGYYPTIQFCPSRHSSSLISGYAPGGGEDMASKPATRT